ncbi:hypothetical protein [Parvularcula dongshanensis]|uniref:Uncharacterized protein n=1 Tax=Parvularcula dongshanensis TaxID=1173995 RepID=A0A840I7I6_9PROT|nr:hypothetical protein [Parvularcula dongshanensis]MBB4659920.1 hypothetical protein [Parvularcula dongshanensis]
MKTYALIAASTLALVACGGTDAQQNADADMSPDQTVAQRDRSGSPNDTLSDDATALDDPVLARTNARERADSVYEVGSDDPAYDVADSEETQDRGMTSGSYTSDLDQDMDVAADDRMGMDGMSMDGSQSAQNQSGTDQSVAPRNDDLSASAYTANNTDAYTQDGNLITGSEAERLSGTYAATVPTGEGDATEDVILYIQGDGDQAVGTFNGEPIQVAVTGGNFTFDAPLPGVESEDIMTFTGTFMDGEIMNGVVESQGDGTTMDWSAERMSDGEMMDEAGSTDESEM